MKKYGERYNKVIGKRNYVIRIEYDTNQAFCMTRGEALRSNAYIRHGWAEFFSTDLLEFTYKKDFLEMVELLKADNVKIFFN